MHALGVLNPHAVENLHVTFDSQRLTAMRLLLTASPTDNTNNRLTRFVRLYTAFLQ